MHAPPKPWAGKAYDCNSHGCNLTSRIQHLFVLLPLSPPQDPGTLPSLGKLLLDNWLFLAACMAGCLVPGILLLRLAAGCSVGLARGSATLLGLASLLWLAFCANAELEMSASTGYEWALPLARIALTLPAGLLLLLLWLGWGHITLAGRLLGQAARALSANSVLIGFSLVRRASASIWHLLPWVCTCLMLGSWNGCSGWHSRAFLPFLYLSESCCACRVPCRRQAWQAWPPPAHC